MQLDGEGEYVVIFLIIAGIVAAIIGLIIPNGGVSLPNEWIWFIGGFASIIFLWIFYKTVNAIINNKIEREMIFHLEKIHKKKYGYEWVKSSSNGV